MNILRGIKVVEVTAYAFVPGAGGVLAHWGADVIKVESPDRAPIRCGGTTQISNTTVVASDQSRSTWPRRAEPSSTNWRRERTSSSRATYQRPVRS